MSGSIRVDRRTALKWVLAAAATPALGDAPMVAALSSNARGYGKDPLLIPIHRPGEYWPLTFTDAERRIATVLCDTIIPADAHSPSASALGVVDFLDEWISAPYPDQMADRPMIREGLSWLESATTARFGRGFADVAELERRTICDPISNAALASPDLQVAAVFFARFRDLAACGFYTTLEGSMDVGFVGNQPLTAFDGPPVEVLERVGLMVKLHGSGVSENSESDSTPTRR